MRFFSVIIMAAGLLGMSEAARILSLLAMPSRSHGILMERLLRELASRGHQVTYITGSPQMKESVQNLTIIHLPDVDSAIKPPNGDKNFNMLSLKDMSSWYMFLFSLVGANLSEYILQQPQVQNLINSDQEFDLVLAEAFLDESLIAGFADKYKAPIVGVMAFMPNIWGNYLVGNPSQSSYIPEPTLGLSSKMNFLERLRNFVFCTAWDFFHPHVYLALQDRVMKRYFGDNTPDIRDILRNTSLVLVNHHHALGFPRPYLPNMVEVGGMHVNPPKALPSDLQKHLDNSKQGAILFSMGSNLRSADLTPDMVQSILKAFGRLPYNVLWKFEAELPNLPKNVMISKWLPQSDILAHKNLKLFITHGGLLSTTEAVLRGVPVLGVPIFGDQPLNMKHTENAGLGKTIDLLDLNDEDVFYSAIMEVTTDPRYDNAAKLKSRVFQDEIAKPLDKAVWWIEYVIRYNGAAHLRSEAQSLSFYQLHQLDVIALLLLLSALALYINLLILKAVFRKCCGSKQNKSKNEKKTN